MMFGGLGKQFPDLKKMGINFNELDNLSNLAGFSIKDFNILNHTKMQQDPRFAGPSTGPGVKKNNNYEEDEDDDEEDDDEELDDGDFGDDIFDNPEVGMYLLPMFITENTVHTDSKITLNSLYF